jgi:hypothetical protein
MVAIVSDRIADGIAKGKTLEQIRLERFTRDYDARYAAPRGAAPADEFVDTVYRSLAAAVTRQQ